MPRSYSSWPSTAESAPTAALIEKPTDVLPPAAALDEVPVELVTRKKLLSEPPSDSEQAAFPVL